MPWQVIVTAEGTAIRRVGVQVGGLLSAAYGVTLMILSIPRYSRAPAVEMDRAPFAYSLLASVLGVGALFLLPGTLVAAVGIWLTIAGGLVGASASLIKAR